MVHSSNVHHLVIVLLSAWSVAAAVADDPPSATKEALDAYRRLVGSAREEMLTGFDVVLRKLPSQTQRLGESEQYRLSKLIDDEKLRFKSEGLIPWSLPMRPYLDQYRRTMSKAQDRLRRVYDTAIKQATQSGDTNQADILLAELEGTIKPQVVAVWRHNAGRGGRRKLFYSNGKISEPDAANQWTFQRGNLLLVWKDPKAPGGAWKDRCKVADDGLTYLGRNQRGTKIRGEYVTK
ncbi:hypothetical protein Pan216_26030 [Planctomycetes bacterium Pan216]|uniref:Uncharacterized protein n=1 Tax=Kolteria novifilia TaxID=2527975 RepID=A0A518B428_9BACT|nr:hypothetical protein Pan216_26030 [Planctomycetes bacterium Pan216]